MSKRKSSTPATGGAPKKRIRRSGIAALMHKLYGLQQGLGSLLTPRYNGIGATFTESVQKAQEQMLVAVSQAKLLPDDWKPLLSRSKKLTAEQVKALEERVARDNARLAEAKAQLEMEQK